MAKKFAIFAVAALIILSGGATVLAYGSFGLQDTAAGAGYETTNAPTITQTVGIIVQAILGFVALVFFGLTLYGGLIWMTARGNDEKVKEAKTILESAIIGIVIVAASFAIARFVLSRLSPQEEDTTSKGSCTVVEGEASSCFPNFTKSGCDQQSGTWVKDGVCQ